MIPIMDFIVYPAFRKMKIRFTPLRRMLAGYFVAAAAMIWATVMQYYIYQKSKSHYCEPFYGLFASV